MVVNRFSFLDARLPPRFWDRVTLEPNSGCWLWIGASTGPGYGVARRPDRGSTIQGTHRWAYEALHEKKIPKNLTIDHLCRVPSCCNPAHLEVVTAKENIRRAYFVKRRRIAAHVADTRLSDFLLRVGLNRQVAPIQRAIEISLRFEPHTLNRLYAGADAANLSVENFIEQLVIDHDDRVKK